MKARVFKGRGPGGLGHRAVYRAGGEDIADTSAQLPVQIERRKGAARFGEMGSGRIAGNFAPFERRENRCVSQLQKSVPLFLRELSRWLARFYVDQTMSRQRHRGQPAEASPACCAGLG